MFKIPAKKSSDSDHTAKIKDDARATWKNVILRTREETKELRERFKQNNIYLCENHFDPSLIDEFPYVDSLGRAKSRKILQTGTIPDRNLPQKTLDLLTKNSETAERRVLVKHEIPSSLPSFPNLKKYFDRDYDYLKGWTKNISEDSIILELREEGFLIPKFHIEISKELDVSLAVYGASVPKSSAFFLNNFSKMTGKFKELHTNLYKLNVCKGILFPNVSFVSERSRNVFCHVIPMVVAKGSTCPVNYSQVYRSNKCEILLDGRESCVPCTKANKENTAKKEVCPAKTRAPLSACSSAKLVATVREDRIKLKEAELKCTQLEQRLERMNTEINNHGIQLDEGLQKSMLSILNTTDLATSPHMKLIYEQQQKAMISNKHGHRWHPHFIEFCLSIHAKSSAGYNDLRRSANNPDGLLYLPHERTLRDYRNHFIKPEAGFVVDNILILQKMVKDYSGTAKYVVLVFDEMKIKGRLVFDKHLGKIVGFTSLGDPELDFSTFDELQIATHVLAFMVRGVQTSLKFMLAYFYTRTIVSYQLMTIFWRAVAILEMNCKLFVVSAVSDGMSANRKFYKLHRFISGDENEKCIYRTINLFAPQRYIWFWADVPHLMKTSRGKYQSWLEGRGCSCKLICFNFFPNTALLLIINMFMQT